MAALRVRLLLPLLPLLLGACELFYDPAAPPFDDRLAVTRTVDDIFGNLREGGVEMTVLDNGSRRFLVVRGRDKTGRERTVAFDERLRVRMNLPDLWDVRNAYVDAAGNFVIERILFSGTDFSQIAPDVYGVAVNGFPVTGIATTAGVVVVRLGASDGELEFGPLFADDWSVINTQTESVSIHPDPLADPPAARGFELRAAQHDFARGRSAVALWNWQLSRMFVIEISAELAASIQGGSFPAGTYLTDETARIILPLRQYDPLFYTRRGVVVVVQDRGEHQVYDISSGKRIDTYHADSHGDFSFAYSPDGKWVYCLDQVRLRLYKASTWW